MAETFLISDHHFGHNKLYHFTDENGDRIRPWAENAFDADELMIEAWNKVVSPADTVYHLGDVAMNTKALKLVDRLKGRKILIRGNHDHFKLNHARSYFADIHGSIKLDRFILTHYPVHPGSIPHWCLANIHGHLHQKVVKKKHLFFSSPDKRYINVSIERIGLSPVSIDTIHAMF